MNAPRRLPIICASLAFGALALGAGVAAQQAGGQVGSGLAAGQDPAEARRTLADARVEADAARARAESLEADAARASAAAERTASEAAAIAARIQQAEAEIAASQARIRLIDDQRAQLRARLAEKQRPLMRLTAALQRLSRRPLMVALLRPGSVEDAMHMRALIETMLPQVRSRTLALRGEIARGRALQKQALSEAQALREEQAALGSRRQNLDVLETQQRLAARDANGSADREAEKALALAEKARDLDTLVGELDKAAVLRGQLAHLPGPVLRPAHPDEAGASEDLPPMPEPARLRGFQLPVAGRLVSGFGDRSRGNLPTRGIAIAAMGGAQVVAPAAGRVAFAGPYPGYGQIVILDHGEGWTSLVTGLAEPQVRVGDLLVAGSPLGVAGPGNPVLTLEVRRNGDPVNPLDELRGR